MAAASYFSFNSLFEMRTNNIRRGAGRVTDLLSILYLRCRLRHSGRVAGRTSSLSILYLRCRYMSFRDMVFEVAKRLSILYLRCAPLRAGPSMSASLRPFNSLFEMPAHYAVHKAAAETLSILYLRCWGFLC